MVFIIFGAIFALIGIILVAASTETLIAGIVLLVCGAALILIGVFRRSAKKKAKKSMADIGATWSGAYKHVTGLLLAENAMCKMFLVPSGL